MERLDAIAESIRVRQLQVRTEDLYGPKPEEYQSHVVAKMRALGFTQAPVVLDGVVSGFVIATEVTPTSSPVADAMHDLDPGMLVAADMTIGRFLPHLREARFGVPRFYFVLDSHAISGLVTRADLNKEAARAHFYLKIAAFELVLSTVVRAAYPDDAFLGLLDKGTTLKLETRYRRAMHSDVQVTKAAYLDFRDLLAIVRATPASLRALGIATVSEWDASTSKVAQLRDRVFHTPRNMIDEKLTIDDLVDLDQRLSSLIDRPQNVIAW